MSNVCLVLMRKDGSPVYLALSPFTEEEISKAKDLEKQIARFKLGDEHGDLREAITHQAFDLVVASAERVGATDARTLVERIVKEVGCEQLWRAVRGSVAK